MKTYEIIGPDGIPLNPFPANSITEVAKHAASFVLRFAHQGYYRDIRQQEIPLHELPGMLFVREDVSPYVAYAKYVTDNMDRIAEGWVPVCFEEFEESEECENYLERLRGLPEIPYDDEGDDVEDGDPYADDQRWEYVGEVGVDSAKLLLTDPCYIGSEWSEDAEIAAPYYKHEDGTVLYCSFHGVPPQPDAVAFGRFTDVIERYGTTAADLLRSGKMVTIDEKNKDGHYSPAGCYDSVGNEKQGGQLYYKRGHAGVGVVVRTGFGDGVYPVYARYVADDICGGRRVAEVRVLFVGKEAEQPAYMRQLCEKTDTKPSDWRPIEGPHTGVGVEMWFGHVCEDKRAYVCVDQGEVTEIEIYEEE